MAANPRGRPKMLAGLVKSNTIIVRLSVWERIFVEDQAKAAGMKLSDWVRSRLLSNFNLAKRFSGGK